MTGGSFGPRSVGRTGRATEQANRVLETAVEIGAAAKTFGPVNAYHTIPRLLWIKENEPERYRRIHWVLEPKDYISFRLCGKAIGDRISLSRLLAVSEGELPEELFERLGLSRRIIPPMVEPQHLVGSVRENMAPPLDRLAGAAVFAGRHGCLVRGAGNRRYPGRFCL